MQLQPVWAIWQIAWHACHRCYTAGLASSMPWPPARCCAAPAHATPSTCTPPSLPLLLLYLAPTPGHSPHLYTHPTHARVHNTLPPLPPHPGCPQVLDLGGMHLRPGPLARATAVEELHMAPYTLVDHVGNITHLMALTRWPSPKFGWPHLARASPC